MLEDVQREPALFGQEHQRCRTFCTHGSTNSIRKGVVLALDLLFGFGYQLTNKNIRSFVTNNHRGKVLDDGFDRFLFAIQNVGSHFPWLNTEVGGSFV